MKTVAKLKELEARLERTEQQLRLFQKISRFMVRDQSLPDVLQGIVSLMVEFMQCDSCLIYLHDGEELVLCASNTPHPAAIGRGRRNLCAGRRVRDRAPPVERIVRQDARRKRRPEDEHLQLGHRRDDGDPGQRARRRK
jgi:GAF domain-containing protein